MSRTSHDGEIAFCVASRTSGQRKLHGKLLTKWRLLLTLSSSIWLIRTYNGTGVVSSWPRNSATLANLSHRFLTDWLGKMMPMVQNTPKRLEQQTPIDMNPFGVYQPLCASYHNRMSTHQHSPITKIQWAVGAAIPWCHGTRRDRLPS